MKKFILAFALLFGVGINSLWAQQEIPMQFINEGAVGNKVITEKIALQ